MKTNYLISLKTFSKLRGLVKSLMCFAAIFFASSSDAQQSYTFTPAGATGSAGPTQTQINNSYTNTNLSGSVTVTNGIQSFTIPVSGGYRIEAFGAQGGGAGGGRGAYIKGDFTLTAGQVLNILVGQQGGSFASDVNISGGGGSYVVLGTNTILVIAGGGGATKGTYTTADGRATTAAENGYVSTSTTEGAGGTGGSGGGGASCRGGGGGGWSGSGSVGGCGGSAGQGGTAYQSGGYGGGLTGTGVVGGFGGGGSSEGVNTAWTYCGGGGGYSGGGGASTGDATPRGGGGGSINNGASQINTSGVNYGHGKIIITELCNINITATGLSAGNSLCSGNSVTLTTNAVSNYSWSTGATTQSIVISPTSSGIFSLTGTSAAACNAAASISITVNGTAPSLSIANTASVVGGICLGKSATLTASGALSYTWSGGTNTVTNGIGFTPSNTGTYIVTGTNACGTSTAATVVSVTPLLVAASTTSSLICSGSTATLSAFSGVNGYTWQPGFHQASTYIVSTLVNTIYTVTASDGTCAGTATVGITTNPIPTVNVATSATNICLGDAITLTATGGNNYTWTSVPATATTTGQSTLAPSFPNPGAYAFYASGDNTFGCTSAAQVVILVNTGPLLNANATKTLVCTNGASTLNVSGADLYQWSANANSATTASTAVTPASTTTYVVTGTLSATGCSASTNVVVQIYTPTITITPPSSVCVGSAITLTGQVNNPSSGATNSYTWSVPGQGNTNGTSVSVAPATPIVATLTAKSTTVGNLICIESKTTSVGILPAPTISVVPSRTFVCRNEPVDLIASGGASYTWNNNSFSGTTITVTHQNLATYAYTVVGTDADGCKNEFVYYLKINGCQGISEVAANSGISVYPNPNNGEFYIHTDKDMHLQVINELGQVIRRFELNAANQHQIQLNDLAKGIYFIVGEKGAASQAQKIIVR